MNRGLCSTSLILIAGLSCCGCQDRRIDKQTGMDLVEKPWPVWAVAFSPDGLWLASGRGYRSQAGNWMGGKGEVNVWKVEDWKLRSGYSGQFTFWVGAIAFTPDSKNLIAASDRYIQSEPLRRNQPPKGRHQGAGAPNPWNGHVIYVWKVPEGTLTPDLSVDKGRGLISSLAISPDGEFVALGRWNTVPVLRIKSGRQVYELNDVFRWVDFSPGSKTLAAASGLPVVYLYNSIHGTKLASLDLKSKELTCLRFSPDGKQIAVGDSDGSIRLLAADLSKQLRSLEVSAEKEKVQALAYAAKADLLAAATTTKVRLFEASSGKQLREWGKGDLRASAVALSPDGKLLAVGYCGKHDAEGEFRGGYVNIWDTATGRLVKKLE